MKIDTYNEAKGIQEDISKIESKMRAIHKMKERENDEEFNDLRTSLYSALDSIKWNLQQRFEKL